MPGEIPCHLDADRLRRSTAIGEPPIGQQRQDRPSQESDAIKLVAMSGTNDARLLREEPAAWVATRG